MKIPVIGKGKNILDLFDHCSFFISSNYSTIEMEQFGIRPIAFRSQA